MYLVWDEQLDSEKLLGADTCRRSTYKQTADTREADAQPLCSGVGTAARLWYRSAATNRRRSNTLLWATHTLSGFLTTHHSDNAM